MSSEAPDPQLTALEAALTQLRPSPGALARDQLLFRAGQASVRQHRWLWPCATAASLLLASGLGLAWLARSEPQQVQHLVIVRETAPAALMAREEARPPVSAEYLRLREQVLRRGLDALPHAPPTLATEPGPSLEFNLRGFPGLEHRPTREKSGDPS